ncbi:MAG: hypothetical protein DMG72_20070 [Acidobacteria bacterium]|nr:MAG: hypothetical protein DMG72_20070 [Acidobacteriota bacterium]
MYSARDVETKLVERQAIPMRPTFRILRTLSAKLLALICAMLITLGCATVRGPRVPRVFKIDKTKDTEVLDEVKNYRDGKCLNDKTRDCPPGRKERDTIVYDLKMIIDRNYEDYAHAFERLQNTAIFLGETSGASLTAVATLVGATQTKDILTTASTLAQSTSVSAQKNYYQKQTSYAILNVMDSDRANKWSKIYDNLATLDVDKYPLSAALSDLVDYRRAGTAFQALTSIQQAAGAVKETAGAAVEKTNDKLKAK